MPQSTWGDISNDPDFKNLTPAQQAAAKQQYSDTVLATDPAVKALSPDKQQVLYGAFGTTAPTMGSSDTPAPLNHYTLGQVPGAMWGHLGHSAGDFYSGVVNAAEHPIQTAQNVAGMIGGIPGAVAHAVGNPAVDPNTLANTATAVGQHYKDAYGGWDNIKRSLAEHPVQSLADLSMALTAGGGGLGAAADAGSVAARLAAGATRVGEAINPMNPFGLTTRAANAAGHAVRGVANAISPQSSLVLGAMEGRGPAILNALNAPGEIVPGSAPTAAQAASPVGATRFSALGKSASDLLPTQSTDIQSTKITARNAAIRTMGGTPEQLQAAIDAANTQAENDYGISDPIRSAADDKLLGLMRRPSLQDAFERARQGISGEQQRQFQFGENVPAQTTPVSDPVLGLVNQTTPAQYASYPGYSLQRVKEALDKMAYDKETHGIGAHETADIRDSRQALINWIGQDSKNPAWATARQNYADAMRPVNRMQIGQQLESILNKPLTATVDPLTGENIASQQRADAFASALDNPLSVANVNTVVKKATGQQRVMRVGNVATPDEMDMLNSVRNDLARSKQDEAQANTARRYKGNLNTAASDATDIHAPGVLGIPGAAFNILKNTLAGHVDAQTAERVGNAMLTPQTAAPMVQNALNRQAWFDNMSNNIERAVAPVNTLNNRAPGVYNLLNQLNSLRQLRDQGLLSQTEYQQSVQNVQNPQNQNALAR